MSSDQRESSSSSENKKVTLIGSTGREYKISQASAVVITYLKAQGDDGDEEAKKKFETEFVYGDPEKDVLFEVFFTAIELDLQELIDIVCEKIPDRIKNKSVEWVRKAFEIKKDLTEEEEAEIKALHPWAFDGVDPDED